MTSFLIFSINIEYLTKFCEEIAIYNDKIQRNHIKKKFFYEKIPKGI